MFRRGSSGGIAEASRDEALEVSSISPLSILMLADLDQSWRDLTGGALALAGLGRVMAALGSVVPRPTSPASHGVQLSQRLLQRFEVRLVHVRGYSDVHLQDILLQVGQQGFRGLRGGHLCV